jgi:hypothetical protein
MAAQEQQRLERHPRERMPSGEFSKSECQCHGTEQIRFAKQTLQLASIQGNGPCRARLDRSARPR